MKFKVNPIYGWGWFEGGKSVDVPDSFTANVDKIKTGLWHGFIMSADHDFYEFNLELTARHKPDDGHVNIIVKCPDDRIISGFAIVDSLDD